MAHCENNEVGSVKNSKPNASGTLKCLDWLTKKLKLVEDGATPPNWKYIGLVFLALFSSASTLTFLFPFLPEMMLTLGYTEANRGTYVGIVAASVFAGRAAGSIFWGWLADRKGRKIVLLITIAFNGLFAGLFGFASNLTMAVIFRFLCGAANGTIGTSKTVLYDISDNTNQALSMSMLSISWGLGMIIGPTVGGLLASPAIKWPGVFSQDGLFGQYPYLLASSFPFVSCALIVVIIFFKFDETFVKSSKRKKQEIEILEVGETDSSGVGKESQQPLLGDRTTNQNSLLQICQSMHSVHAEAESAAFLASETVKYDNSTDEKSLVHRTQSVPNVNTTMPISSCPEVSYSVSNIFEKNQNKTHNQINIEDETQNKSANSSKDLSSDKLTSTKDKTSDYINNKLNHNEHKELDFQIANSNMSAHQQNENGSVSYNGVKDMNEKAIDSAVDDQKVIENEKVVSVDVNSVEENEQICTCVESLCHSRSFREYSLFKLLRLSDVWATVLLYTVFSIIVIGMEDIFPVFASTGKDYGGLGFSTNEIGLALGAVVIPLLLLQIKLYPFLVSKMGIRKVFLFSTIVSLFTCQLMPMVRLINNRVWLWVCLLGVQIPYKIATNCCFAGTSLLINNSVPQELAGQANGLAIMTTALGRTAAPILAGLLFSWTVTYGEELGPPFDTSFPFFIIGALFFASILECLHLNPRLDKQKK